MTERIPIDKYCEKRISTLPSTYEGLIDYVDISSVDNIAKEIVSYQTISSKDAPSRAKQLLKRGDILVSTVRPNLHAVAMIESETENLMVGSTGYCVLRCKENADTRYLFNFCQSPYFVDDMSSQATGASYPAVSNSIVRSSLIPSYSVEEQRKIADKLDAVSELIKLRKQQLSKLDQLVKSRFIELFGDQETNPYNLNVGKLSDIADIYLGLTHTPTYVEQGKPFLSVRDISSGVIDFSNCHYITEEEFDSLPNGARPQVGDMLFCRVGTIGKPVIIPENTPEFGTFVSVGYLRKKANVNNYYLKSWMENDYFMRQVYDNVAGASQINLNTGWLKNFRILIPSLELQEQFAAFVEQVDKSKLAIQKSLEKLEILKKSLMQQYFG